MPADRAIRVSAEQVMAARVEVAAFKTAGLRVDPIVWLLAQTELEEDSSAPAPAPAPAATATSTLVPTEPPPYAREPDRTIYLAGPIAGRDNFNRAAFEEVAAWIVDRHGLSKFDIRAPHDIEPWSHAGPCPPTYAPPHNGHGSACYMRSDLAWMLTYATDVVFLDDHETSRGASLEEAVAREVGLTCWYVKRGLHGGIEWIAGQGGKGRLS